MCVVSAKCIKYFLTRLSSLQRNAFIFAISVKNDFARSAIFQGITLMLSQCAIQRGFNYRLNISRRDREGDFDGHYNRYCVLRTNNNSNAVEREAGRSAFEVRVLLMYCVIRCIARLGTVEIRFRANFGHCAIFTGQAVPG